MPEYIDTYRNVCRYIYIYTYRLFEIMENQIEKRLYGQSLPRLHRERKTGIWMPWPNLHATVALEHLELSVFSLEVPPLIQDFHQSVTLLADRRMVACKGKGAAHQQTFLEATYKLSICRLLGKATVWKFFRK